MLNESAVTSQVICDNKLALGQQERYDEVDSGSQSDQVLTLAKANDDCKSLIGEKNETI